MPDKRFPFSNFQKCIVYLDGQVCSSVEHAYQAAKTLDPERRVWVIEAKTPAAAKRRGRKVTLRSDWDEIKIPVMLGLLRQKFAPEGEFARQILDFEAPIVEYNTWHDTFWGCCTCPKHQGQGSNWLGVLLTSLRQELLLDAGAEVGGLPHKERSSDQVVTTLET